MINDRMAARLGWSVPAITIALSSLIHLISGNNRAFPFFISESDHPGLERWVFTAGLFVTGIILCYVSYRLWIVKLEESRKLFMHASLLCGIWVGGNLAVMSFANIYDYPEWHIITALNVFHFGLAWGVKNFTSPTIEAERVCTSKKVVDDMSKELLTCYNEMDRCNKYFQTCIEAYLLLQEPKEILP